ncbi:uncharacterized protein RHO17_017814 [Thomomys bottae]
MHAHPQGRSPRAGPSAARNHSFLPSFPSARVLVQAPHAGPTTPNLHPAAAAYAAAAGKGFVTETAWASRAPGAGALGSAPPPPPPPARPARPPALRTESSQVAIGPGGPRLERE